MVRRVLVIHDCDNPAFTDDDGITLRGLHKLSSTVPPEREVAVRAPLTVAPERELGVRASVTVAGAPPTEPHLCAAGGHLCAAGAVTQEPHLCAAGGHLCAATQETRFGAISGVSEAKPKPSWTIPDVTLSRVKDKAIGFVRQGSSKRFHRRVVDGTRRVKVGGHGLSAAAADPGADPRSDSVFPDNRISTSKYSPWSFVPVNLFQQFRRLINFYYAVNIAITYSVWSFLPKNLFEQFRRVANLYFLCIAMIQCMIDSPVSPVTSALPLGFVVFVTMLKQGYEDWLRHKMDDEVNNKPATVVRHGVLQEVKTKHIAVGDIVRVRADEEFPCDLVLLTSSDREGQCHIQTANLDGETNLKTKESPPQTRRLRSVADLDYIRAVIECENPRPDLYKFVGAMRFEQVASGLLELVPLGPEHVLLRGSQLKNTATIYGCVIYTGQDTKLALNLKITSNKFSSVEKSMNKYLIFFLLLLLAEVTMATLLSYFNNGDVTSLGSETGIMQLFTWYLADESFDIVNTIFSFLVIFNYIIPISLYVTVEMVKFVGTRFMEWDDQLVFEGAGPKANTSDLNEELGQVEYLFSDKTGTLTENDMRFQHCSIAGRCYVEVDGALRQHSPHGRSGTAAEPISQQMQQAELDGFLTVLALCHTVQVTEGSRDDPLPSYQASSPDEQALVEACRRFGVVFGGISDDVYKITVQGSVRRYRRLHLLEFDPDRKRMSVIVEDERGRTLLLCKGADSAILGRCVAGDMEQTAHHVTYYAMLGLRTLVFAWRELTQTQLDQFSQQLLRARSALRNREEAVLKISTQIESELELLGATGVEDKLQDGVPETLETLRAAGVKVWVVTGDKIETAVNIATSCGHLKRGTTLLHLVGHHSIPELKKQLLELDVLTHIEQYNNFGLVLDGESLTASLHSSDTRHQLLRVATRCQAVLCCRMSPIQKAEVVKLVKYSDARPVTAAIGDGANDVSMIQEAHVGFGLVGREGRQAARCSDFSFGRFRFLRRIMLVHGHWYYVRLANLVQYSFYKNVAFITPQLFFAFSNLFSTMSLYDSFYLTFYNMFFTAALPIAYGVLEQDIPAATLYARPDIYRRFSRNALLGWSEFVKWTLLGMWHASVAYFLVWYTWKEDPVTLQSGRMMGVYAFGSVICQIIVVVVNIKMIIMSRYMTAIFISFFICGLTMMGLTSVYSALNLPLVDNNTMTWVYEVMAESATLWLLQLLLVCVSLLPDLLMAVARTHGRGLAKCTGRLRVLLGVSTRAVSTLPASSRHSAPLGSVASTPSVSVVSVVSVAVGAEPGGAPRQEPAGAAR